MNCFESVTKPNLVKIYLGNHHITYCTSDKSRIAISRDLIISCDKSRIAISHDFLYHVICQPKLLNTSNHISHDLQ